MIEPGPGSGWNERIVDLTPTNGSARLAWEHKIEDAQ
jgi:hypothetical protein